MMELILIINVIAYSATVVFLMKEKSKEQLELVREITKALTARSLEEYVETIPEDNEEEEEVVQDELEDVSETSPELLINQLNKEYENIKN